MTASSGEGHLEFAQKDDVAAGVAKDEPTQPDLILHVAVGKLTEHASHALEPAIADVWEREMLPQQVFGNSHYGSDEQLHQMAIQGIEGISPAMPPKATNKGNSP